MPHFWTGQTSRCGRRCRASSVCSNCLAQSCAGRIQSIWKRASLRCAPKCGTDIPCALYFFGRAAGSYKEYRRKGKAAAFFFFTGRRRLLPPCLYIVPILCGICQKCEKFKICAMIVAVMGKRAAEAKGKRAFLPFRQALPPRTFPGTTLSI